MTTRCTTASESSAVICSVMPRSALHFSAISLRFDTPVPNWRSTMFLLFCAQIVGKPVIAPLPTAAPAKPAAPFRTLRRPNAVRLASHLHVSSFSVTGDRLTRRPRTCTSLGVHDRTTGWPGATGLASKRASGTTADNVSSPATSTPTCTVEPRYSTERVTPRERRGIDRRGAGLQGDAVGADGDELALALGARHGGRQHVVAADEAGDEGRCRLVEHLARGAGLLDPALVHHHDEVGQRHRLFLAVGDMDEGDAEPRLQRLQLLAHLDAQERVERRQRLVEQQDLRIGDQRARQRHALLLAAGELRRQAAGVGLHLHELQHARAPARGALLVDAAHLQAEGDVVDAVEMREQRVALEHHRRAARRRRQIGDVLGAEDDVALARLLVAGDHAQGRGLAAAADGPSRQQ